MPHVTIPEETFRRLSAELPPSTSPLTTSSSRPSTGSLRPALLAPNRRSL